MSATSTAGPDTSVGREPTGRAGGRRSPRRPRSGWKRFLHDLRHRRRRFRQAAGIAFVILVTLLGHPLSAPFWIGVGLAVLGMSVRLWASGFVVKNEVLATTGPYGYVRHPLYVGNILICAGFCLASGLWWSAPLALVVLLLFYPDAIRYEDEKLRRLFGEEWDSWARGTRALLPRAGPVAGGDEAGRWSLRLSMMRNGEPLHVVVLGGCLIYLSSLL